MERYLVLALIVFAGNLLPAFGPLTWAVLAAFRFPTGAMCGRRPSRTTTRAMYSPS